MGCIDSTSNQNQVRTPNGRANKYKNCLQRYKRLETNVKIEEIMKFSDEEKNNITTECIVYTCPICTNHYNKILACSECSNCVCLACFLTYAKKTKGNFKCYFCASYESVFKDYEGDAHLYFDTTNNGFLNKEEREKIDDEMNFNIETTASKPASEGENEEILV